MNIADKKSYLSLIEHKNFSIKKYKHQFVKSFLSLCEHYVKSSFTRDDKIKVAIIIYEHFFTNKSIDITSTLQHLTHYLKKKATTQALLSDLFFTFLSDYSQSHIQNLSTWSNINTITVAIDNFIKASQSITPVHRELVEDRIDIMPDDIAINFLESIRQQGNKIRVLNTYNGIPIEFSAKVVHTSATKVLIKAHALQNIAASFQGGIYILCESEFGSDLYANVKSRVFKKHDLLELSQFDQLSSVIHKRQTVRVYPEIKTNILINNFTATLFDISVGGAAVVSSRDFKLELYEVVTIKIPDILCGKILHLNAELIHVSRFETGFKYHFKLDLSAAVESDISKYLIQRQKEIVAELKEKLI
ncbi:MAG: PilZ domain-containing protein [Campylobacterota bacterium]|nr:PilZ domain-containing protein [Campylobacterota bacterium]